MKSQVNNYEKYQLDSIIPVFKFSENRIGLTLTLWEYNSNKETDNLLSQLVETDSLWTLYGSQKFDTEKLKLVEKTENFKFFTNKSLVDSLSYLIGKQFFIFGENGICKSKISDILFCLDECRTSFILLTFENIDKEIGNPLIAMKNKVEIEFERNISFENEYNQYLDTTRLDYTDTIPSTNFAKWNEYYLFYSDNFKWYLDTHSCEFPSRTIVFKRDKYFSEKWHQELDLFGVPCD
ncbi:MAG: hypothetical protein A2X14_01430 [Bacteroidetes bacterium GWD2_33_33]|nr:MAG: hypothetical protein A2X14_01430 [Bacteroidetes bacterium GWD2_33_33]